MNANLDGQKCSCACGHETDEQKFERLKQVIDSYSDKESSLIQILHMAQGIFGCVPPKVQEYIAEYINVPVSKIYGVVTFYTLFSTEPRGEHTIKVCMGTACYVRGAQDIIDALTKELDVDVGGTTKDGKYTLEVTRCLGACGLAPVMMIDDVVHQMVDPTKIKQILNNEEVK